MINQAKNVLIGVFLISAVAIVTFMLLFLRPSVGDEAQILRVRFADIDKVTVGTRVTFAGNPVGEVVAIRELESARHERIARNGIVYVYELDLAVDSGVNVYNSDQIALRTSGLLGEKSVMINPEPPKPGQKLRLINNEIIYADETGSVEDTFREFKEVADRFDIALDMFIENLNEIQKNRIWDNLGVITQNVSDITTALNVPEDWSNTLNNVQDFSEDLLVLAGRADDTFTQLQDVLENVDKITTNGNILVQDVMDGKGSLGKLLVTDETFLQLSSILGKGETLMNDINHYGVLFHLDKGWQRLRARRLNLLQRLQTPQEFRNYFNDELDQISTSLARVSMVLDETYGKCDPCCLLQDPCFTQVFAELMRRISLLEEEITMYNGQLVDSCGCQ
jgi:phospholipid/cholesterol/gamma-HCH transport system substrate-binding protein